MHSTTFALASLIPSLVAGVSFFTGKNDNAGLNVVRTSGNAVQTNAECHGDVGYNDQPENCCGQTTYNRIAPSGYSPAPYQDCQRFAEFWKHNETTFKITGPGRVTGQGAGKCAIFVIPQGGDHLLIGNTDVADLSVDALNGGHGPDGVLLSGFIWVSVENGGESGCQSASDPTKRVGIEWVVGLDDRTN